MSAMKDAGNEEKEFLTSILSLAGESLHQAELLSRLVPDDFLDPFLREVFRGFCRILRSGYLLNLDTMAEYFHQETDLSTFIRVCREIQVWEYITYDKKTAERLETLAEDLGMKSDDLIITEDAENVTTNV